VDLFDVDALDEDWPFEVDQQAAHPFKDPKLGLDDVADVWASDPMFYPAKPPAHWLMVAETGGRVLTVPLAPSRSGDPPPVPADRLLPRQRPPCPSLPGGPMTDTTSHPTPEQEHALYADPVNQEPQGPGVRRRSKLSAPVPVRFPEDMLQQLRDRAADDDRSVSQWIRRAVERELARANG